MSGNQPGRYERGVAEVRRAALAIVAVLFEGCGPYDLHAQWLYATGYSRVKDIGKYRDELLALPFFWRHPTGSSVAELPRAGAVRTNLNGIFDLLGDNSGFDEDCLAKAIDMVKNNLRAIVEIPRGIPPVSEKFISHVIDGLSKTLTEKLHKMQATYNSAIKAKKRSAHSTSNHPLLSRPCRGMRIFPGMIATDLTQTKACIITSRVDGQYVRVKWAKTVGAISHFDIQVEAQFESADVKMSELSCACTSDFSFGPTITKCAFAIQVNWKRNTRPSEVDVPGVWQCASVLAQEKIFGGSHFLFF